MSDSNKGVPVRRGDAGAPAKRGRAAALPVANGPVERRFGDEAVLVDQVHRVRALSPKESGPWDREADKIAWTDPASGLACIIRRASHGGHLCGYVGVEPGHPLFGFRHDAFPHVFDIGVHGGLSYSERCEGGPEETSVCHPTADDRTHGGGDTRWWFGFSCDQPYDLKPGRRPSPDATMAAVPVYRDEAYVFGECVGLAAQLNAIGEGRPLQMSGSTGRIPIGLDPERTDS